MLKRSVNSSSDIAQHPGSVEDLRPKFDERPRPGPDWTGWKLGRYLYMVSPDRHRALRRVPDGWDTTASADEVCRCGEPIGPPFWVEWEYEGRTFLVRSAGQIIEIAACGWSIPEREPVTTKGRPANRQDWVPWAMRGREYLVAPYLVHAVELTEEGWMFVGSNVARPRRPLPTEPMSNWHTYRLGEREFRVSPLNYAAFERVGDGWQPAVAGVVSFWCWPEWPKEPVDPPGSDWTPWYGDGRHFMIAPDERSAAEKTAAGWVYANEYAIKCRGTRLTDFAKFQPGPDWLLYDFDGRHYYVSPTHVALTRDGSRWRFAGTSFWIEENGTPLGRPGPRLLVDRGTRV